MKLILDTLLTLTSPLHITAPGENYIGLNDRFTTRVKGAGRFPCTRMRTLPIGIPGEQGEGDTNDRAIVEVPEIPANGIAGRMRRIAGGQILDRLAESGSPADLGLYHVLTCGSRAGQPNSDRNDMGVMIAAAEDPYFGTFGGGPKWFRRHFKPGTGLPVCSALIENGMVPQRYASHAVDGRLIRPIFFRRVDDALQMSDGNILERVEDFTAAVQKWVESIADTKKAKAKAADSDSKETVKKSDITGFNAMELVIPGARFYFRTQCDFSSSGLAGLGLIATSFATFANEQGIGGWTRNGFGRFNTEILFGEGVVREPLLTLENGVYSVNTSIQVLADAVGAWESFEIDRAKLNSFAA
jgi:CRISPR type IV-associated protein Csf2